MIIPISPKSTIEYVDGSGSKFFLRYLLGENQDKFTKIRSRIGSAIGKFLVLAREQITLDTAKTEGKTPEEVSSMIFGRAQDLADEAGIDVEKTKETRELIDLFLCGWEGKGFPPFPEDGKPSEYLKIDAITEIFGAVSKNLEALTGLAVSDRKN